METDPVTKTEVRKRRKVESKKKIKACTQNTDRDRKREMKREEEK